MRARVGLDNRLFRQDRAIAINIIRANFSGWRDLVLAGAVLVVILAIVRAWFDDQPWKIAAWAAFGIGAGAGMGVGRLLRARIAFHSFDGLLAADAVQPLLRRGYMVAWHGFGIATAMAVTLVVRPPLVVITAPAYLTGALMAGLTARLAVGWAVPGKTAMGWNVRRWLHRPAAGVVAAVILLVSLLPAHALEKTGVLAIVGMEAVVLALAITPVEQDIVRFKAISGHGPWRITLDYARGLVLFAGITASVCWVALGPLPAGITLAASAAMLLLLAMRILAYCVHDKRFADFLVSIFAGLLMLTAYSMPVLLPVLVVSILWQLRRRAAEKTWLLA
ncbi:hypothetical protein AB2M62_14820 [Sphingomonas sp. MMS12-HWE2-04]|uniref:hypothetical protein n=1 Tax=Sphingomonas sp. MMS12-HWE2-04 TaxID=3234199 RepID=UPI00384D3AB8